MSTCQTSIIIPVFNQWDYTRQCLKSLAATVRKHPIEVRVIDNASTDITPRGCPVLGNDLFGAKFHYHRCEENINFGPASNLGANTASGEFLLFLNNDTIPLPGWYESLLEDFERIPKLGATGPVLVYPETPPLGHTVQHLGVYVSPFKTVGHLYEGIPASSPLARKRRFFQVITAACMMMPKALFLALGGFDSNFRNGFEDVDLCARLSHNGYKLTISPEGRVIHFQGRTQGRYANDGANSAWYSRNTQHLLTSDWQHLLEADGYMPGINAWLQTRASLSAKVQPESGNTVHAILEQIINQPLWEEGWKKLACATDPNQRDIICHSLFKLFPGVQAAFLGYHTAAENQNSRLKNLWFNTLAGYCLPLSEYEELARQKMQTCLQNDLPDFAGKFADWLGHLHEFARTGYNDFMNDFWRIIKQRYKTPPLTEHWAKIAFDYQQAEKSRSKS